MQDIEVTVEMIEAEFARFGALQGGRAGVSINSQKFNPEIKTAQVGGRRGGRWGAGRG